MPRPPKHKHQLITDYSEMRQMRGWIVKITYRKCVWSRCKYRKREVRKLEKL